MQEIARGEAEKIFENHEKFTLELNLQKEELTRREKELEKRQANNENERQKIELEKQMVLV